MSEIAAGVYLSGLVVPEGEVLLFNAAAMGIPGPARHLAVNPRDWDRMPKEARERFLDTINRKSAEAGLAQMQAWLDQQEPSR